MVLFVFGFLPLIGRGFELICPGRRERGCCDLPKGHTTRDIVHKLVSSLDCNCRRGRQVSPKTLMSLHTRVFHPFPLPAWPWEVGGFGPQEMDFTSPLVSILGAPTFPIPLGFRLYRCLGTPFEQRQPLPRGPSPWLKQPSRAPRAPGICIPADTSLSSPP